MHPTIHPFNCLFIRLHPCLHLLTVNLFRYPSIHPSNRFFNHIPKQSTSQYLGDSFLDCLISHPSLQLLARIKSKLGLYDHSHLLSVPTPESLPSDTALAQLMLGKHKDVNSLILGPVRTSVIRP